VAWTNKSGRDATQTYIWVCALCINQHRLNAEPNRPEDLQKEFGDRVAAIGRILPMLDPWDNPGCLKRAWCLFELVTAIQKAPDVEINIILSPAQQTAFHDAIVSGGPEVIDPVLDGINSAAAAASKSADLDAIRALIKSVAGGFEALDETVRNHLRRWAESQGGAQIGHHLRPRQAFTSAVADTRPTLEHAGKVPADEPANAPAPKKPAPEAPSLPPLQAAKPPAAMAAMPTPMNIEPPPLKGRPSLPKRPSLVSLKSQGSAEKPGGGKPIRPSMVSIGSIGRPSFGGTVPKMQPRRPSRGSADATAVPFAAPGGPEELPKLVRRSSGEAMRGLPSLIKRVSVQSIDGVGGRDSEADDDGQATLA